jgi:hypothetical protein
MTHAHSSGLDAPQVSARPFFSEVDWEKFRADDRQAAAMVIGLMTAIFSIGLVLYVTIFFIVLG